MAKEALSAQALVCRSEALKRKRPMPQYFFVITIKGMPFSLSQKSGKIEC